MPFFEDDCKIESNQNQDTAPLRTKTQNNTEGHHIEIPEVDLQ